MARGEHFVPEPKPLGGRLAWFEPGQHAIRPHRMVVPPSAEADVCGLFSPARRDLPATGRSLPPCDEFRPWSWISRLHFPASLGSTCLPRRQRRAGVTSLPHYHGRSLPAGRQVTPAGRLFGFCWNLGSFEAEPRLVRGGSSCLSRPPFPPFCPQPSRRPSHGIGARSRLVFTHGRRPENPAFRGWPREDFPQGPWRGLRTALAGSPVGAAESGLRGVM
jgi:hypothetical protein